MLIRGVSDKHNTSARSFTTRRRKRLGARVRRGNVIGANQSNGPTFTVDPISPLPSLYTVTLSYLALILPPIKWSILITMDQISRVRKWVHTRTASRVMPHEMHQIVLGRYSMSQSLSGR